MFVEVGTWECGRSIGALSLRSIGGPRGGRDRRGTGGGEPSPGRERGGAEAPPPSNSVLQRDDQEQPSGSVTIDEMVQVPDVALTLEMDQYLNSLEFSR